MTWRDALTSFCKDTKGDIDDRITQSSDDSESVVLYHAYKEKCKSILTDISTKEEKTWEDHGVKLMKEISQLILDVTYVKEVELVDDDFPAKSAESDIKYIIDSLTSLETLSMSACPEEDLVSCLGSELVECLRWRKGALLYMFCHTVYHQNPIEGIPSHQLHYLEDGVDYLVSMLKTRSDAKWIDSDDNKAVVDDGDTLRLIEQGIFSDTHLLALMYCGEMCYWHSTSRDSRLNQSGSTDGKKTESKDDRGSSTKSSDTNEIKSADSADINNKSDCDKLSNEISEKTDASRNKRSVDADKKPSSVTSRNSLHLSKSDSVSKMIRIGNACLKHYVSIAHGPLASAGWSTDRADDIIFQFQKLNLS